MAPVRACMAPEIETRWMCLSRACMAPEIETACLLSTACSTFFLPNNFFPWHGHTELQSARFRRTHTATHYRPLPLPGRCNAPFATSRGKHLWSLHTTSHGPRFHSRHTYLQSVDVHVKYESSNSPLLLGRPDRKGSKLLSSLCVSDAMSICVEWAPAIQNLAASLDGGESLSWGSSLSLFLANASFFWT